MQTVDELIDLALREDIGPGDVTTESLVGMERVGTGTMIAKEALVTAGANVVRRVFRRIDPAVEFRPGFADGERVEPGAEIAEVRGPLRALLTGERTALNFFQRLSGIATLVRRYVEALGEDAARLVDTRKTTPGWRALEKYAVRAGGARNHRMGLYDGVLIKDNHIEAAGGIPEAVAQVRARAHHPMKIEVEASNLQQVRQALAAGVDVIMLDNMTPEGIREAAAIIGGKCLVEVSGGVNLDNIRQLAASGVDIISVGALTHSAKSVDISMNIRMSISV